MRKVLWATTVTIAAVMMTLGAGLTGAYFTGQAKVAENVIKAGTVAVSAEPTSAALSIPSLAPGMTVAKTVTVVNDGTLPCEVVVSATKSAGVTAFWDSLATTATANGSQLYAGPLSALKTAPVRLSPGQRADLGFGLGVPASATNDLAGEYAKFTLVVDAEQVQ